MLLLLHYLLNVVENKKFREVIFMLRKETEIPSRTSLRNRVMEVVDDHFEQLSHEMKVQISP